MPSRPPPRLLASGLPPHIPEAAVRFVLESMECAEEENALMFRDEHIHLI